MHIPTEFNISIGDFFAIHFGLWDCEWHDFEPGAMIVSWGREYGVEISYGRHGGELHLTRKHADTTQSFPLRGGTGVLSALHIEKGYGFIRDEEGIEHFFHRTVVRGAVFELLREGQQLEFLSREMDKGPLAVDVRLSKG